MLLAIFFSNRRAKIALLVALVLGYPSTGTSGTSRAIPEISRNVSSSMRFPQFGPRDEDEDVLRSYPAYLRFILKIGMKTDREQAKRLHQNFISLKKRDSAAAARFLRSLRYELLQYFQASNVTASAAHTDHTQVRNLITRYLPVWAREADELNFSSYAATLGTNP